MRFSFFFAFCRRIAIMRGRLLLEVLMLRLSACFMFIASVALAQNAPTEQPNPSDAVPAQVGTAVVVTPPPPATRLEAIQRRTGQLLIRGYSEVASIRADDGTVVRVPTVELIDVGFDKARGIAVEIRPATRG